VGASGARGAAGAACWPAFPGGRPGRSPIMNGTRRILLPTLLLMAAPAAIAGPLAAQLIPVRSVPVAAGDQFLIYPSRNLAMGGVSVALRDPLLDPFVN